jgi:uncharacterized protein YdeI (YjbR/CyaY-like superfamily)
MKIPDHPLHFQDPAEWRAWLQEKHATQSEAWLVILRKHMPRPGVYYEEAVEEAVCFGWIDGVTKSGDERNFHQRFSPRRRGSTWSLSNIERVERLIAQGRMTEAGMAKVMEGQESGQWEAAIRREEISNLPHDLQEALSKNAAALANFESFPASQVKMFLHWIASAKTAKTRQERIQRTVQMAADNQRFG